MRDNIKLIKQPFCRGQIPDVPFWILFDKQILTFYANFEKDSDARPVKIMYYLEDGTMKVVELKNKFSMNQGTIVGRQRIPLPGSNQSYFGITDLNIGYQVEIYGKHFLIMDCDYFTRQFLNRLGVKVPSSLNYAEEINQLSKSNKPYNKENRKSLQFLQFDGMILRFSGYWDDRQSEYGTIHYLEVLYYLADDTMEILEKSPSASKAENGAVFLRRALLPKTMHQPQLANYGAPVETYRPPDLTVGAPINVYGRLVILTDCDLYTKEYYRSKYGIENIEAVSPPDVSSDSSQTIGQWGVRQLPPWNGLGSHADSAGNCNTMSPKAPHCDFYKFLHKDSIGPDSHILRFTARLLSDISDDDMRQFIVSYYLKDDAISVFEVGIRNSGFRGGMFYKRNVVMLPEQNLFQSNYPVCYTIKDMWIGNVLSINNYRFLLVGGDDYSLGYMEQNALQYPKSNIVVIMNKIRDRLAAEENGFKYFIASNLQYLHSVHKSLMPVQCLEQAIKKVAGDLLTQQEFITIVRHFQVKTDKIESQRESIRSQVYTYTSRYLWQDNAQLHKHFKYLDDDKTGFLARNEIRNALKGNRLPIPNDLLDKMLDVIQVNEEQRLGYDDVIDFLNFKLKPAQSIIAHPAKSTKKIQNFSVNPDYSGKFSKDDLVNWDAFTNYFNLEHTINEKS
ncbi:EF-hand domain-containing family member C2-like [Arctopsyche grandis]|uniref:EF-hand domain-containing family member C2-like n=1 Tax=Arctopsyche grandis TaxID=121162 RepID=UPI00406D7814